jgi:hypothetical protein
VYVFSKAVYYEPHDVVTKAANEVSELKDFINDSPGIPYDSKNDIIQKLNGIQTTHKLGVAGNWNESFKTGVMVLFLTSLFAPPIVVLIRYLGYVSRRTDSNVGPTREHDVIDYLIYFIPFFILSLALLFQIDNVLSARTSGMAAIAGVMILYMLSNLGVGILHIVNNMKNAAVNLETNLANADSAVKAIPAIEHYSRIIGSGRGPDLASGLRKLMGKWGAISGCDDTPDGLRGVALRTLLSKYFEEEYDDVSGTTEIYRVPKEVWPFPGDKAVPGQAAFFATNVGFYTHFLAAVIDEIRRELASASKEGKFVPCVATITNVLPSHFWNWPRHSLDKETRHIYEPIIRYRNTLRDLVDITSRSRVPGRVYRTVLVSDNDAKVGMDSDVPLWTWKQWEWEEGWHFRLKDGGPSWCYFDNTGSIMPDYFKTEKKHKDEPASDPDNNYLEFFTSRSYVKADSGPDFIAAVKKEEEAGKLARYHICRVIQSHIYSVHSLGTGYDANGIEGLMLTLQDGTSHFRPGIFKPVNQHWKEEMSPDWCRGSGYTQILGCSKKEFLGGFRGRPDVLFVGSSLTGDTTDIWNVEMPDIRPAKYAKKQNGLEWYLMLLATMSPQSETMFLTVVYDYELIRTTWDELRTKVTNLYNGNVASGKHWHVL